MRKLLSILLTLGMLLILSIPASAVGNDPNDNDKHANEKSQNEKNQNMFADEPLAPLPWPSKNSREEHTVPKSEGDVVIQVPIVDPPIVCVDPGHGGSDPGAVNQSKSGLAGHSYLMEKDVSLDVGLRLKDYLVANYGATVYMTRSTDIRLGTTQNEDLKARTNFCNSKNSNIMISIHENSSDNTSANGVETYYYFDAHKELATDVYNQLLNTGLYGRGVKQYGYYVLANSNAYNTLSETGFVSNSSDADQMLKDTFRQDVAVRHAKGIHLFWWGY